jgi:hypothetical protein
MGQGNLNWWERRVTVVALSLFATIPLLWPTFPRWALIGNLRVDLLTSVVEGDAPGFTSDPSQTVQASDARDDKSLIVIDQALANFPRRAFDYLWLINPPEYDERPTRGMTMTWRQVDDVLFRIGEQ